MAQLFSLDHMHAPLLQFAALLLAGCLCGCDSNEPHHLASSEPPAIVISQAPNYPMPGHDSEFHGGLVIKFWRDGHMIRAAGLDTVGKSYIEGFVGQAPRDKFFASLGASAAMQLSEGGELVVDSASETITVRRDGKTSKWYRTLPDTQSAWREFELRLINLPLSNSRSLDLKEVESMSWNE